MIIAEKKKPIFITGDERSGTTFLSQLVVQNHKFGIAPECNFITRMLVKNIFEQPSKFEIVNSVVSELSLDGKFLEWGIDIQRLTNKLLLLEDITYQSAIETIILDYCSQWFPDSSVWGVKKPIAYVYHAEELLHYFPESVFIQIIRDGRAVFNSKKKTIYSKTGKSFESDPYKAAERWASIIRLYDTLHNKWPDNFFELCYEDLILKTDSVMSELFSMWGTGSKEFPDIDASQKKFLRRSNNKIHPNVEKEPMHSRVDAWKNELTALEIKAFEDVARYELTLKGYQTLFY